MFHLVTFFAVELYCCCCHSFRARALVLFHNFHCYKTFDLITFCSEMRELSVSLFHMCFFDSHTHTHSYSLYRPSSSLRSARVGELWRCMFLSSTKFNWISKIQLKHKKRLFLFCIFHSESRLSFQLFDDFFLKFSNKRQISLWKMFKTFISIIFLFVFQFSSLFFQLEFHFLIRGMLTKSAFVHVLA